MRFIWCRWRIRVFHLVRRPIPWLLVDMSQEQKLVSLLLKSGKAAQAIATGNNAAWLCPCGRALPLVGRSGAVKGVSENTKVKCPTCERSYFVVPDGYDQAAVLEVREVGSGGIV